MRDFSNDCANLALNTATLGHMLEGSGAGWSPEQVIDACAERGFGGLVLWRREVGERAFAIGERIRAAGMQVAGLCRSPFLVGPLAFTSLSETVEDFNASVDTAAELGAATLTVVAGGVIAESHSMSESLKTVTEILARVAPYAERSGVKLALEPLHPVYGGDRSCLVTVRDALAVCRNAGSKNIGIAIDVYHVWWDLALDEQLSRLGDTRILGYHLCDWLAHTKDTLFDRGMMGDGVADLKKIRKAVEDAGYDGLCEVEIFSERDWWLKEPDVVLDTIAQRFKSIC
ncbi:MAG: sugar phosphate isomerase/epimerase [Albidovulum sp.]|nr:sugar phosphate isomerase/epimerase [Albidovulum sp.]